MLDKIKTLCAISGTDYDTTINKFIDLYEKPIKKTIKEEFIFNPVTYPIIETGLCEIIAGQYLNSLKRGEEKISLSSFTYEESGQKGEELINSGYSKLAPFTKDYNELNIYYYSPQEVF